MNKRFLALLLAIAGLIALGLVVWFVLLPAWSRTPAIPIPSPTGQNGQTGTQNPSVTSPAPSVAPEPGSPEERERLAQEALKRFSIDAVARSNSYSNVDGFASLQQAELDATSGRQAELKALRLTLSAAHPSPGPSWGVTTKALSARIISGTPVVSASSAVVTVQAQKTQTESGKEPQTSFVEVRVTLEKVGTGWRIAGQAETTLDLK
jgi:hypothetical protein